MSNIIKIILISGIFLDIFSKYIANNFLQEKISIFGDFFYISLVKNPGIAFGVEIPSVLLKIMTLILIIGIFYYYKQERNNYKNKKLIDISFSLILAGATGNAIERIFLGEVTDFIGIQYFSVFNFADSFITIGVLLYFYIIYKNNKS